MIVLVLPTVRKLAIWRTNEVAAFCGMNRHLPKLLQTDKVEFFNYKA